MYNVRSEKGEKGSEKMEMGTGSYFCLYWLDGGWWGQCLVGGGGY